MRFFQFFLLRRQEVKLLQMIPDDDSSLSSLLTSQSNFRENWVQLFLFPRIRAAEEKNDNIHKVELKYTKDNNVPECRKCPFRYYYKYMYYYSCIQCINLMYYNTYVIYVLQFK